MVHKIINKDFSKLEGVDNLVNRIKEVTRVLRKWWCGTILFKREFKYG